MKPKHIIIQIFVIILVFAVALTSQAKETIVFWYGASQDERAAYEQMIAQFEHENPDIHVKAMLVPQTYVERKLILSISGGVPPDVVRFYAHLGGELMSRGGLEPLNYLVKRDNLNINDFFPVGIKQNTYNGKLYGIPWILSPNALFYNKKLFREAGLDPNKPPKTWSELQSYAMKLTKRGSKGLLKQVGYADFLNNPPNFDLYLWQSGGELVSVDGKRAIFNSSKGKFVLQWMKSFIEKEAGSVTNLQTFTSNFKGATQDPFGQGVLAMRVDSPFRIPDLKKYFPKLDYGVAPIPYSNEQASEVVGNALVIPKGSKHREAAWRFIKFASSAQQVSKICQAAGRIPARISAAHSKQYYGNPMLHVFIDQIEHGKSIPIVAGWQEVSDTLARSMEQALKGKLSADKALNGAAASSDKILKKANEDMSAFPVVPWKTIGIAAAIVFACVVLCFVFYVRKKTENSSIERREAKEFYLYALPWIIGFILFTFGATLASLVISFSKWDTLSAAHFIGIKNYIELFTDDPRFYKSLWVTLYYAVFSIPLSIIGGLAISLLMNQKVFGIRLFRTIYYLPVVISGVATAVLWQYVFNPSNGILNKLLTLNVIPGISNGHFAFNPIWANPPGWLIDPKWSMPAFIIMGVWGIGGAMIVYLAALQGVPEDLYEAAKLDGAGPWKSFVAVTLPMLTPAIFYQLIVGTMYSLQMFTQAYIMTNGNGGPEDSTLFYALYLFKNAFEFMKMGYASAMAWILFIIVLIITAIHLKMSSRWVYYEGAKEK